ncbi:MAG TPA: hypothetical protein VM680_11810 [Verrucomicrobiae bacterium]|nr:hypothetical protein [Verrucomicrobiae bacterium]
MREVSATNIFARADKENAQFLVYEMRVAATEPVAMVLPLPVDQSKGENGVRFIDLQGYPNLFESLYFTFSPPPKNAEYFMGMGGGGRSLAVQKVGAYDASFVPTIADFLRLDERFRLPDETWKKLPAYKEWGLRCLSCGRPSSGTIRWRFRLIGRVMRRFFSDGSYSRREGARERGLRSRFVLPAGGERAGVERLDGIARAAAQFVDVQKAKGIVDGERHCYKYSIKGRRSNRDIYVLKA